MNAYLESPTIPNLEAVKATQKAMWESGDFGQIARRNENIAEEKSWRGDRCIAACRCSTWARTNYR